MPESRQNERGPRDFGHGNRHSAPTTASATSVAASVPGFSRASTQKPPSRRTSSRVAPCLRRKPANACSGAAPRGPRSSPRPAAAPAATGAA